MSDSTSKAVISQEEELEIVKGIEKLVAEFNDSVEDLAKAEDLYQDIDTDLFKVIINDYNPSDTHGTESYKKTITTFIDNKQTLQTLLKKQSKSFRILQKLRSVHVSYLQQVILSLQTNIKTLNESAAASAIVAANPIPSSATVSDLD